MLPDSVHGRRRSELVFHYPLGGSVLLQHLLVMGSDLTEVARWYGCHESRMQLILQRIHLQHLKVLRMLVRGPSPTLVGSDFRDLSLGILVKRVRIFEVEELVDVVQLI